MAEACNLTNSQDSADTRLVADEGIYGFLKNEMTAAHRQTVETLLGEAWDAIWSVPQASVGSNHYLQGAADDILAGFYQSADSRLDSANLKINTARNRMDVLEEILDLYLQLGS